MKEKVVNYFYIKIKKNYSYDDIKLEQIKYGLYGLYTLVTKSVVIILLAIILGITKEFFLFTAFYIPLRSVGYGTHAKSNTLCWLYSTVLQLGLPLLSNYFTLNIKVSYIIWFIFLIMFILFAPADTKKRPIRTKKKRYKLKTLIVLISILYLIIFTTFKNLATIIILAMFLEVLLISPIGYLLMGEKPRIRFK